MYNSKDEYVLNDRFEISEEVKKMTLEEVEAALAEELEKEKRRKQGGEK